MATAAAAPRASWPRRITEAVGFAALALIGGGLLLTLFESEHSYGPSAARDIRLTVAQGVSVEVVPSAASLAAHRFTHFDITPSGAILVGDGRQIFDMASGDALGGEVEVKSFAATAEALAVFRSDNRLGYFDGQAVRDIAPTPIADAAMVASSDRSRLFLYRTWPDDAGSTPALVSYADGQAPQLLAGSFEAIGSVGGDAFVTYFSVENALYQVVSSGRPNIIVMLPRREDTILGIASAAGATYFSTTRGVYLLTDELAVPVVLGLGGQLRVHGADLYVLSAAHGRVYRVLLQGRSAT